LQWRVAVSGSDVVLTVRSAEDVHGITLDFRRQIDDADGGATLLPGHHKIVLPEIPANEPVVIHIRYIP
jgi:hypothetical protein